MVDANDRLFGLGITLGEALEAVEAADERKVKGARDKRICMCGHPVARHRPVGGRTFCQPSRMSCACADLAPAVKVPDTRLFLRLTTGVGAEHALVKGLASTYQRELGDQVEWLIDTECVRCGSGAAFPVGVRRAGDTAVVVDERPQSTQMLCASCTRQLRGR